MGINKIASAPGLNRFLLVQYLTGPSSPDTQSSPIIDPSEAFRRAKEGAEKVDNSDIIANFLSFLLIHFRGKEKLKSSFEKFYIEQQAIMSPAPISGNDPLLEASAFFPHASRDSLYTLNTVRKFIEGHIEEFFSGVEVVPSAMSVFSQYLVHYYSTYPGHKTWRDQPIDVSSVTTNPENRFECYFADRQGNIYPVYRVKKPMHTSIIQRVVDSAWADLFMKIWGKTSEADGENKELLEQRQFVSVALMKYASHPWYLVLNTNNDPIAFISALPISIGMNGQPEMKAIYVSGAYTIQDAKGLGIGTFLQRMVMNEFSESLGISERDLFPIIFRTNNFAIVKNLEGIPKRHFEIDFFDGFSHFEKYFRVWLNRLEACSSCGCIGRRKISDESTGDAVTLLERAQVLTKDPRGNLTLNWDFVLEPVFWNSLIKTWDSGRSSEVTIADLQIEAQDIEPFEKKFKPKVQAHCEKAFAGISISEETKRLIQDQLTDLFITFMMSFPRTKESDIKMAKIAEICVPITLQVICDARAEHKEGWPTGEWERRESKLKQDELAKRWNPVVPALKKILVKSKNDIRTRKRSMIYNIFDFFRKEGWVSIVLVSYPRWISASAVEGGFLYRLSTFGNRGIKRENEIRYQRAIAKKCSEIESAIQLCASKVKHSLIEIKLVAPSDSSDEVVLRDASESKINEGEPFILRDVSTPQTGAADERSRSIRLPVTREYDPKKQIERMRKELRDLRQEAPYNPRVLAIYIKLKKLQERVMELQGMLK